MISDVRTTQIFSRRSMGFLWDKRGELDAGQVKILDSIYNNKKKSGVQGTQQIIYRPANSRAGKLGYGRLYGSKGSFETLERACRGTICKDFYYDIDMVNCHPVILIQYVTRRGLPFALPETNKCVFDREGYLAQVMAEREGMPRWEAKQLVLAVMYGGMADRNSCLFNLSTEVRKLSGFLMGMPEYADLKDAVKNEKNVYGTFLALVLQSEERKCMLALKNALEDKRWSVDVLCYDGVMIRKREGVACDDPLLREAEASILAQTGYQVSLAIKEFEAYDLPAIGEQVAKGVTLEAYQEMKADFERNHFYHPISDQYVEVNDDGTLLFMVATHAKNHLTSKWFFKHSDKFGDYTPFFDIWAKDTTRRSCSEVSFKPSDDPNSFTIPINFAHTKGKVPDQPSNAVGLFLELVKLITSNDDILTKYVLDWCSHLLQQPLDLPGVALVLTGAKGIGKDTFGDFLQEFIVGKHLSTNYTTNKQFFGTHDTGKLNKFLIKLEETSKKDCFENASELKSSITATRVTANPKGIKEITAENFARFIFTTNKANPVDMSDNERRFVLLRVSSERRGDHQFWSKVRQELFNLNAGAEVAKYLMERDINDFQVRNLPENHYQQSIIKSEETSEAKFIQAWDGKRLSATEMYEAYTSYCRENHLKYATDISWFGRNLQSFVREGTIINTHTNGTSYYKKGE